MDNHQRTLSILDVETGHNIAGYEDYKLYKVTVVDGYRYGEGQRYILTREKMNIGDVFDAQKGDELIAPAGIANARNNLPLRVYRPDHCIASHYTVKKEILPQDWPQHSYNFAGHRLFAVERKASGGYAGELAKVFSKVAFNPGEDIRADEVAPARDFLPHMAVHSDAKPEIYTHDEGLYQKRVWETVKRACSHSLT